MTTKRKGAVRRADIPPAILRQLNRGEIEALTLAEVLAVDFAQLLQAAFPDLDKALIRQMKEAQGTGWVGRTKLAGALLAEGMGKSGLKAALKHPSDQVRGWGASLIAALPKLDLEERLALVRPLADDSNAGTREVAWISLRPHVAAELKQAFRILRPWTRAASPNLRRYASEITRPRGVWCAHIPALREDPSLGASLLEPLRADPARYVQNSVANWLNDASKDDPVFVRALCKKWLKDGDSAATAYICRRAQRTLNK